ncbi:sugar ABC transporter ATP-binding protein [Kineosporia succinea]|uniref:Ribose transport system ATP-binding protein n=1 Tax=Kineosporia succinea TaxID=84632 RepID=A0ABT9PC88_9ACTN|nr:sugar ABC transporter ATP-binding protein [Kineosporia succinea]MDP9830319.1 ribose transport system ATP-binding protein [Kineosporia succinea]
MSIQGLTKSFSGATALDGVELTIGPQQVHGLLGENGSGKSTLIKVLSGFHAPDTGTLTVRGEPVDLPLRPGQYRELGFEFVHQDLGLVPGLDVTENLFMADISASGAPYFSWRQARRRAAAVFARYRIDLDPGALVGDIRPVDRAMLAIVRAVESLRGESAHPSPVLVLDEPTVFLPQHEVEVLFGFVRSIVQQGASVLFVSHDLDEVLEITDRVTVLRDGRTAGSATTSELTKDDLVRMIIGRDLAAQEHSSPADVVPSGSPVLSVQHLCTDALTDVSFELRSGEVLGIAGLVGSGYEDVVYALYGADQHASGSLTLEGSPALDLRRHTPRAAVRAGLALVPADRKNRGSVATLSAADNMNLTVLDQHFVGLRLRHGALRRNAQDLMTSFDVRPPRPDQDYGSFSGGNQQKAMLAKWQQTTPRVLLVHEPTQGVDIGAREQIHQMIRENAGTTAAICASSDYEQLAALCDRVAIIVRGRLVTVLTGSSLTKADIADHCHGRALTPGGPR